VLKNCEFIENYGDYGAGISIHRSDNVTITNCLFKQNRVSSKGGGMHCEDNNNLAIINCRFMENYNSGRYDSGEGGAIYIITGDYQLIDCKFENNHTNYNGGGISNSDACVFIKNCLFAENSAGNVGGAINFQEITADIHNCTISNNSAREGGGLFFGYEEQTIASNVKITNSIIWGNSGQIYNGNHSEITITYSCIQDFILGRAGAKMGIINHAPVFASPGYWADANDMNLVVEPNDPNAVWIDEDYHLKSEYGRWDPNTQTWVTDEVTSPCIDAGDPNTPVGDETEPNGGIINMGAYGGTHEASKSP
jgi:predicted outer membrane repeat protein